jgi:hypothetical protein
MTFTRMQMAAPMSSKGKKSNKPAGPCARTTLIPLPLPNTPRLKLDCTPKAMAYPQKLGVGHTFVPLGDSSLEGVVTP